jgi:hypothetical protein
MAEGRCQESWGHTSSLLAMLANVHRDAKKSKAFKPTDFNPYTRKTDTKIENVGVDVLKMLVKE